MEAIILAGGLGSRLRSVVPDMPKPMAPINGRPFLEYLLDYWLGQDVDRFILSVGYKSKVIEAHFGNQYKGAEMVYAVEDQPQGTGGGLLLASQYLHQPEPLLAMNGDTFFEVDLLQMRLFHEKNVADVTIALREARGNSRYAEVITDTASRITSFDSHARTAERALINGGVYLSRKSVLIDAGQAYDKPFSIEDQMYPDMMTAGKQIYGYRSRGRFIDIGIPEDYRRAKILLRGG